MTPDTDLAAIAGKLSRAQRDYLAAVAASAEPYTPRHGVTANWALRHSYTDTIVTLNDGRVGGWNAFDLDDRIAVGVAEVRGQRLTPLGLRLRAFLQGQDQS